MLDNKQRNNCFFYSPGYPRFVHVVHVFVKFPMNKIFLYWSTCMPYVNIVLQSWLSGFCFSFYLLIMDGYFFSKINVQCVESGIYRSMDQFALLRWIWCDRFRQSFVFLSLSWACLPFYAKQFMPPYGNKETLIRRVWKHLLSE